MVSKKDQQAIESDGGVATMPVAPEGSAERLADEHDDDFVLHPEQSAVEPIGHVFCETPATLSQPWDVCGDCGYIRSDHTQHVDPLADLIQPGDTQIRVTDYTANGEAVDHSVKETAQQSLPGVPKAGIWGDYQGHRLSHVQLSLGGSPDAPTALAGRVNIGDRVYLVIGGDVAKNGYAVDKDGVYYGQARIKVDTLTVLGKDERTPDEREDDIPPELIRKSLVTPLVTWAARLVEDGGEIDEAWDIIRSFSRLFDPLPFEEDETELSKQNESGKDPETPTIAANSPENPDATPLDQSLAEAMAEA